MSALTTYFLFSAPMFSTLFFIFSTICAFSAIALFCAGRPREDGGCHDCKRCLIGERYWKKAKVTLVAAIVCAFIGACLPGRSALYSMVGAYYLTNIKGIDKLPPNLADAANSFLKKVAKENAVEH